jgi:hypothetical protein
MLCPYGESCRDEYDEAADAFIQAERASRLSAIVTTDLQSLLARAKLRAHDAFEAIVEHWNLCLDCQAEPMPRPITPNLGLNDCHDRSELELRLMAAFAALSAAELSRLPRSKEDLERLQRRSNRALIGLEMHKLRCEACHREREP